MNDLQKKFVPGEIIEPKPVLSDKELDQSDVPFAVHCSQALLNRMVQHAVSFKHTEVFGLLLGSAFKTPSGKLRTFVENFIPAQRFHRSTLTFVEVSAAELIRMDRVYEESEQKDLLKVGWFHTHPGHGIFMSHTDKENHSLYRKPWQVALVIDPIHETYGFFHGNECSRLSTVVTQEMSQGTSPIGPSDSVQGTPTNESITKQTHNTMGDTIWHRTTGKVALLQTRLADRTVRMFLRSLANSPKGYENAYYQAILTRLSALMSEIISLRPSVDSHD